MKIRSLLPFTGSLAWILCAFALPTHLAAEEEPMIVTDLRCEGLIQPNLIDTPTPRFSWRHETDGRGARQTNFQFRLDVLSQDGVPGGNMFISRRIPTELSQWVTIPNLTVSPKSSYKWQVRAWDEHGDTTEWSEPAYFSTSLIDQDWQAEWISDGVDVGEHAHPPARHFRKQFTLPAAPTQATLYLSAFGLVEPWLNGERVGEDYFTPGWPDYRKRNYYVAYNVTDRLQEGPNAMGLLLGDGWYSGTLLRKNQYGPTPMVSGWMEMVLPDGTKEIVATDDSWTWSHGPITAQGIYYGEDFDARKKDPVWSAPQADSEGQQPVVVAKAPEVPLEPRISPPVRRIEEIQPIARREISPDVFIYDLGQNMVGWVRLKLEAESGQEIRLRFAEMLESDGSLHTANLRSARASAHYTAAGEGVEVWEPRFSFFGFRYVEVSGLENPRDDAITGVVVHTDLERIGHFECSNPMLNQLYSNTVWGQKGNFLEIPTDCPQRNERLGWTGDAQVFCNTAHYNFRSGPFYEQWLAAVRDSFVEGENGGFGGVAPDTGFPTGAAGWSDAGVIVPWVTWLHTGDTAILAENFEHIERWIALQESQSPEGIRISKRGWGDWLAPGYKPRDAPTPYELIATAYFAYTTHLAGEMAKILQRPPEVIEKYTTLFAKIKNAFQDKYIDADGKITSEEQTAYLMALGFNLVSDELRPAMIGHLEAAIRTKDNHLATGFLGTPLLAPVLTRVGLTDLAYEVVLQESYPGWLFSVKNGATTIWERWDSWTPEEGFNASGMNSFNHYAYGSIVGWFYDIVAGIRPNQQLPGWKHFFIDPRPGGGLTYARASLDTPYGEAISDWKIEDGQYLLHIKIPPNTLATVRFHADGFEGLTEGGTAIEGRPEFGYRRMENGRPTMLISAGEYRFSVPLPEAKKEKEPAS